MAMKAKVVGREALNRRLRELAPKAEEAAAKAKLEVAKEAASRIAAKAPVEFGDYKASIQGDYQRNRFGEKPIDGQQSKDPDATAIYAEHIWRWIEFGTAPHKIRAKIAPALVFRGKGGIVVTDEVSHPGSRAQPHVFTTWRAYRPKALRKVRDALNKAVREVRGK